MCTVLSKLSQKLQNCVTSPLNFASIILGSLVFDGRGAETVELGCELDDDESTAVEPLVEGDLEAGGTEALLEADGFDALFGVDVETRRVGESLEVDAEAGGIEAVIVLFS